MVLGRNITTLGPQVPQGSPGSTPIAMSAGMKGENSARLENVVFNHLLYKEHSLTKTIFPVEMLNKFQQ